MVVVEREGRGEERGGGEGERGREKRTVKAGERKEEGRR